VPLTDCPLRLINTEAELNDLVQLLKNEKEIAVDLEVHSYNAFIAVLHVNVFLI
jgi:ribonuclease D